jgi:hypothetical protein
MVHQFLLFPAFQRNFIGLCIGANENTTNVFFQKANAAVIMF